MFSYSAGQDHPPPPPSPPTWPCSQPVLHMSILPPILRPDEGPKNRRRPPAGTSIGAMRNRHHQEAPTGPRWPASVSLSLSHQQATSRPTAVARAGLFIVTVRVPRPHIVCPPLSSSSSSSFLSSLHPFHDVSCHSTILPRFAPSCCCCWPSTSTSCRLLTPTPA